MDGRKTNRKRLQLDNDEGKEEVNDHASEGHDPICPRAEIEAAWNGAECLCHVIEVVRRVEGVEILRVDPAILEAIDAELAQEAT